MDPTAKPTAIGPPFEGQIKIIAELPPGLNKYANDEEATLNTDKETSNVDKENADKEKSLTNINMAPKPIQIHKKSTPSQPTLDMNLDLRTNIYKKANKCTTCEKEAMDGYHKDTEFICTECYEKKETKDDYIKEEQWTDQEDLLLLEGLEMYPTDWEKITEHVSTQTRDACILHYLKLPTADPRIDPQVKKLGLLNFDQKEHVDNPIMSVVAFLASHVKPKVAASSLFETSDDEEEKELTDMDAESERLEATYNLIRAKISHFSSRMTDFDQMESVVDEQRRTLERERFLIRQDQLSIRNQMDSIYHIMFQHRQAKALEEQQNKLAELQKNEEVMPNDAIVKCDPITPEEKEYQDTLRAKYPAQYLQRQQQLLRQ